MRSNESLDVNLVLGLDPVSPSVDIDVLMTGFRGLSIINKALASRRRIVFSHFFYESSIGCVEYFAWVYAE